MGNEIGFTFFCSWLATTLKGNLFLLDPHNLFYNILHQPYITTWRHLMNRVPRSHTNFHTHLLLFHNTTFDFLCLHVFEPPFIFSINFIQQKNTLSLLPFNNLNSNIFVSSSYSTSKSKPNVSNQIVTTYKPRGSSPYYYKQPPFLIKTTTLISINNHPSTMTTTP